jgi:hypothetical protein
MALQLAVLTRDARLNAIETEIGTSPILRIRTGAQPADVATADSGTVLAELTLPSDWMAAASSGAMAKAGTWEDTSANAAGTAAHFRIYTSGGTAKLQGSVTASGGGGDMTITVNAVSTAAITLGAAVTIATFTLTDGNA